MFPTLFIASFVASAGVVVAEDTFWWGFQPYESLESYDPIFEICGSNCSDCAPGARQCFAEDFANICYEPDLGESCCRDKYGTSCYQDFYCAYNDDDVAFCCNKDEDEEECGENFDETLSKSKRPDPTSSVSVTAVFAPSMTASDQSVIARPDRTMPPDIPGSTKNFIDNMESRKDVSLAVKIGAAIGAFIGLAILVTIAVLCILHFRRKSKYKAMYHNGGDKLLSQHPQPYAMHNIPAPVGSGVPTAYEPMRTQPPQDHRGSWGPSVVVSPPTSRGATPVPFTDSHAAYTDHSGVHSPPPQHQSSHIPPPGIH